jgi:hypothetical protein
MNTFQDFKKAIGQRFKVVDGDDKPMKGLMGAQDTIIAVRENTEEVEGNRFIAHYSACRFIQEPPMQFAKKNKTN